MQPARHQVVHQVVAARDRGKDLVHHRLLVGKRDAAIAKMGVAFDGHQATIARRLRRGYKPASSGAHKVNTCPNCLRSRPCAAACSPALEGARFEHVLARRHDLRRPLPKDFVHRLEGNTVTGLGRRAKYLLADLSSGDVLLMHLGMSGWFRVFHDGRKNKPGRFQHEKTEHLAHDHIVFEMSSGATVTFNDPRRFGFMKLVPRTKLEQEPLLSNLGPEPLGNEFDAKRCRRRATARRRASRRRSRTSASSPGSAISMYAKRCTAPCSRPNASFYHCGAHRLA